MAVFYRPEYFEYVDIFFNMVLEPVQRQGLNYDNFCSMIHLKLLSYCHEEH